MAFKSRTFLLALFALTATLVAAYYALQHRSRPPLPAQLEEIIIAVPTVPHAALIYIAQDKGYFISEGLAVTSTAALHGKLALELVVQGKADLAIASEVVFVLAGRSENLALAASLFTSTHDLGLVGRRDRGITDPRDIAGKTFGVTRGTASEFFLWSFLIRHKLPASSVTLVDMPPGRMARALADGGVDGIVSWQPNVSAAQKAVGANAVTFNEPLAYTETVNVIGKSEWLKTRSGAVQKLLRALLKAEEFNRVHADEAIALVASRLQVDVESLRPLWKDSTYQVDLRQSQLNTMEDAARWAAESGYARSGPLPNFLPNLFVDALLAVNPQRVTVLR